MIYIDTCAFAGVCVLCVCVCVRVRAVYVSAVYVYVCIEERRRGEEGRLFECVQSAFRR